ncbi:MAG: non-homologous end-joining DNA ligase [Actinomycetota bacterium]|nr:non-homologous end-joining DNA ligase [Actinomycetota bacterium]
MTGPTRSQPLPSGNDDVFVVQEHHARRLHWDLRLERAGALASWAVPKGLPLDPARKGLAVRTPDHGLEFAAFEGDIPQGEYGGGRVRIWDRGTYETIRWRPGEIVVTLRGTRVAGRYALVHIDGDNWLISRLDPPPHPDWRPVPELVRPMMAEPGDLPVGAAAERWGYEMKWDGVRAVLYADGGRVRVLSRSDRDVTGSYPEMRALGRALGSTQVVLDGELVAVDELGRPSFGRLQQRMHVTNASQLRRLTSDVPVTFFAFDVLHLEGRPALRLPYDARRELLESLALDGQHWQTPPGFVGDGEAALATSRAAGLEGVVAKRRDSPYEPGRRSPLWRKVKILRTQEVVIGGWKPGEGRRAGGIGSLLLGVRRDQGLVYAGHVGTGFTAGMLADLARLLRPLERATSPFAGPVPALHARGAHWVTPALVGEVEFGEWTRDGMLRHPSWRGLRPDKEPGEVVPES